VTSGTIFGSVQDPTGALIPTATITATDHSKGITRTGNASSAGTFSLPNLPPGTYTIDVTAPGFEALSKSGVILNAADNLNAGVFTLQIGQTATTVTVTADARQLQLQSDSGERSDLITGKQLQEVATNGRNVLDYMRLIPGVAAGSIGIPGLYVTEDPGAYDKAAQTGNLNMRFGLGWAKSHRFFTGQTPVLKYNRQLMQAILHDRLPIAKIVNATVITLDDAPQGYKDFDRGAAKNFVIDPHKLVNAAA
jgi:hypothetical protein